MSDRDIILALLHNALLGLYYRYRDKILNHSRHAPRWATTTAKIGENEETVVLELQDLLSLCVRLDQILNSGTTTGEGNPRLDIQ